MTHRIMMCRCAISPWIGVGAGEFKSIRFSPTGVAVGGMLALVERGIGVGATLRRTVVTCMTSGLFSKKYTIVHISCSLSARLSTINLTFNNAIVTCC